MPTMNVLDAAGQTVAVALPNADGRQAASASRPVALSNEDLAAINAIATALADNATGADVGAIVTALSAKATSADIATIATALNDNATGADIATVVTALADNATGADIATIVTALAGTLSVSGPLTDAELRAAAVPVSAASLPLPAGAATAAKQDEATAATVKLGAAKSWFAITPNDGADLATVPDAIYIGSAGDIVLRGSDATDATFAVTAGQVLPFSPVRVLSTGTTATGIVGLVS